MSAQVHFMLDSQVTEITFAIIKMGLPKVPLVSIILGIFFKALEAY
jgi:hypothetical protein